MMTRNLMLIHFALCLGLGNIWGQSSQDERLPNIIFFYVDDMGWTDVGVQGSDFYETPNIDRLASEGMRFTHAYANAANCAPSRACMMTGLYPPRHGIYTVANSTRGKSEWRKIIPVENKQVLDTSLLTWPAYMQSRGYETCIAGKWHLSEDPVPYGFDTNFGGFNAGHPQSYFAPYDNPFLEDGPDGEYLTDRLTDDVCHWLETHAGNPFFLYFPFYSVHTPIQAKSEDIEKYLAKKEGQFHNDATYAAMVETVDKSVGRVLTLLEQLELEENTLIVFSSDNGPFGGASVARPLRGTKGMFYEGGIRIPLIVRWPGKIREGQVSEHSVIGSDLFATVLDIMGDEKLIDDLDGHSYKDVLLGGETEEWPLYWHFPAYLQAYNADRGFDDANGKPYFRTTPCSVVQWKQWKLIRYYEDGSEELYHLGSDISEARNLVGENQEMYDELKVMLDTWLISTGAEIPTEVNPAFDPQLRD